MAAGRKSVIRVLCGLRGRSIPVFICSAALALVLTASCTEADNSATQVVDQFITALETRDQALLDGLMEWDEVALNQYYVTRDYYESLNDQQRREMIDSYRGLFFADVFPAAAMVAYVADEVYIARGTGNAIIIATFPPRQAGEKSKEENQQFNIELSFFKDRNRWYIVDLNDFIQLNMLRGDYDPGTFYLPEPIH